MENNINLTPDAVKAIQALQHPCGTYQFYRLHLDRLFNYILNNSDEIGMSDNEAMHTLRALNLLRSDIADIAGPPAQLNEPVDPFDEIALGCDDDGQSCFHTDQPREMLRDVKEAWFRLKEATETLSEAIEHARKSGERFDPVISDLSDAADDLEAPMAALDAIMAINPDTYEPKEISNREAASIFLHRAYNAAVYAHELAVDALDRAQRDEKVTKEQIAEIEAGHAEAERAAYKFKAMTVQLGDTEES